ncbi:MAG: M12 family metallo-peptidase [Acidobacteriota bacterium]
MDSSRVLTRLRPLPLLTVHRRGRLASSRLASFLFGALALCLLSSPLQGQQASALDAQDPQLAAKAGALSPESGLAIGGLSLETAGQPVTLLLEPFQVFSPDLRIIVHGGAGERMESPPATRYFRGSVADHPNSLVTLAVDGDEVRGIAQVSGALYVLGQEDPPAQLDGTPQAAAGPLVASRARGVDAPEGLFEHGEGCLADELPRPFPWGERDSTRQPPIPAAAFASPNAQQASVQQASIQKASVQQANVQASVQEGGGAAPQHTARVAIETDWELYLLLGGVDGLIDYVGDLFAFASSIYVAEVETTLLVDYLSVWEILDDPWQQAGAYCSLMEFGRYWNFNNESVERTITHFLSGRRGGGIAWTGVLCHTGFDWDHDGQCPALQPQIDHYGGDYGYSGFLAGNFDIDDPQPVWDVITVSHEIGHNFSSPHSHCYEGVDGIAESVDNCHNLDCGGEGCYCGSPQLPCDLPGAGCGTIMSYCAVHEGGADNIAFSFGRNHPYGVAPERVTDKMRNFVINTGAREPGCLDLLDDLLFAHDFEASIDGWSDTVDPDGVLRTSAAAALAPDSTQGLLASASGSTSRRAYLVDSSGEDEHRYRFRFYFDPASIAMDDGTRHKIATLMSDPPQQRRLLSVVLRKPADGSAGYQLLAKIHRDDGSWAKTPWITLDDAPHALELEWLRAGAAGMDDGYLRLWIDGSLESSVFGVDNDEHSADSLRLGLVGGLDSGTVGDHAFDAVEIRRSRYIGL